MLSSGARARYLEDIVRALALPESAKIQFRYDEGIVSPHVRELIAKGQINGERCYLTYLDNRGKTQLPDIVPIREATIIDARKFGSSYIFGMVTGRYVRTKELSHMVQALRSSAQDKIACWRTSGTGTPDVVPDGYWVNFLSTEIPAASLVAHDPKDRTHLEYFEETIKKLSTHADFADDSKRLFFNIIRMADLNGNTIPLIGNAWTIDAKSNYRLELYHYFPEEGTHANRSPFWIVTKVEGDGIDILGGEFLRVDSEYDWKTVELVTRSGTEKSTSAISIYRTTDVSDAKLVSSEITFGLSVNPGRVRNVLQSLLIGIFASSPGLIAVYAADHLTWRYGALILLGGLAAGFASVYRFARSV